MFCQIVTLPRSGSHMLGTAIGSHPDLTFKGESFEDGQGDVEIKQLAGKGKPDAEKYIVLIRDPDMRELSWKRTTSNHFYQPATLHKDCENPERSLPRARKNQSLLKKFSEENECLILNYEDVTGDKDIRAIPEKFARMICEYLGVEYHELTPETYKPSISET